MRKVFLKLTVLCTAICLALCCGLLAACGDDENPPAEKPENTTYNVTVQLENGTPVQNIALKFCILDENGTEQSCFNTGWTNEEGKVSVTLKTENYHVAIAMVKAGSGSYEEVSDIKTDTLESATFTFIVKQK